MSGSRRTVFVLGAGASAPYGFPIGKKLVQQICDTFPPELRSLIHESKQWQFKREAERFVTALRKSAKYSIDAFLQHNPQFWDIGKLAIAIAIMRNEQDENLRPPKVEEGDNWYRYLSAQMSPVDLAEFPKHKIAFITYNYEKSLEYYLHTSFVNSYQELNWTEAGKLIGRIPIVHVHGQLAPPHWDYTFSRDDESVMQQSVFSAAKGIKIVYDDAVEDSPELNKAWEILENAKRLIFLGFGYDPVNLERLKLGEKLPAEIPIEGTLWQETATREEEVRKLLARLLNRPADGAGISLKDCRNLEMIKHHECWRETD